MKTFTRTESVTKNRLIIRYDEGAGSPREDTNAGYFITCEKKKNSPDNEEELQSLVANAGEESENATQHMTQITIEMGHNNYGKVVYITPVYRYEHGNVVYKRGKAHGFDYSNCGFYIVTDKTLAEVGAKIEDIEKIVDAELEIYTSWVNGEVYSFTVYDENGKEEESFSGGFYSLEDVKEELGSEWKDEDMSAYLVTN